MRIFKKRISYLFTLGRNKKHLDSNKGVKHNINGRENLSLFISPRFLQQLNSSTTMAKHAWFQKKAIDLLKPEQILRGKSGNAIFLINRLSFMLLQASAFLTNSVCN